METNKQSLASIIGRNETQSPQNLDITSFYNTYLNVVSSQIFFRFPVVNDLNTINQTDVQSICNFSFAITPTVIDTWRNNFENLSSDQFRQWFRQQRRTA